MKKSLFCSLLRILAWNPFCIDLECSWEVSCDDSWLASDVDSIDSMLSPWLIFGFDYFVSVIEIGSASVLQGWLQVMVWFSEPVSILTRCYSFSSGSEPSDYWSLFVSPSKDSFNSSSVIDWFPSSSDIDPFMSSICWTLQRLQNQVSVDW